MALLNHAEKQRIDNYVSRIEVNADEQRFEASQELSRYVNSIGSTDKREEAVRRICETNRKHVKTLGLPDLKLEIAGMDTDGDGKIDKMFGLKFKSEEIGGPISTQKTGRSKH